MQLFQVASTKTKYWTLTWLCSSLVWLAVLNLELTAAEYSPWPPAVELT